MTEKYLVRLIDLKKRDFKRIQYIASDMGFQISDQEAATLAEHMHPLPHDDEDIVDYLADCLEVIPFDNLENVLKEMSEKYNATLRKYSGINGIWEIQFLEKKLFILTRGLDSHPEWYECPCMCAECRSYE